jgi:hypothetical protein
MKTVSAERSTQKPWFDEYYRDMTTLRMHPVSEAYLLKFAMEWVEWSLNPANNCTSLEEFFIHKRINTNTVYRWQNRCEELQAAHDFVKEFLYTKRDKGAVEKRYDSAYSRMSMPMYSNKFRDLEEWRAKTAQKIASTTGQPYVVVERFE